MRVYKIRLILITIVVARKVFRSMPWSGRLGHVVIPHHWLPVSLTHRVVSNYILMTWLEEANFFVIGAGLFTIVYLEKRSRIRLGGGREMGERGGGREGLKFVRFVQSRSREWTSLSRFFFFLCNTRIKVNGSYFREIMKGQAYSGSNVHLFRALSFSP